MPSPISRNIATGIRRSSREADFIFVGRIEQEAASGLPDIAATPRTSIVRIERIMKAPHILRDFDGQQATVVRETASEDATHSPKVFFTVPIAFGETIGLREIGSIAEPDDLDAVSDLIAQVEVEMSDERLREHLREADVVVHGRVVETTAAPPTPNAPLSEHSPEWRIARIEIISALKGSAKGVVSVRYPGSTDVRWYAVPKPTVGEEGLFILHRDRSHLGGADLAILHQTDVVRASPEELERHRRHL